METSNVSDATAYVSVPITTSAVTSTTHIPWVELLGERKSLVAYTSGFSYVSSACLNAMYEDGLAFSAYDSSTWSTKRMRMSRSAIWRD